MIAELESQPGGPGVGVIRPGIPRVGLGHLEEPFPRFFLVLGFLLGLGPAKP